MSEVEGVIFDLDLRITEQTISDLRRVELLLTRYLSLLRRMGLPEELDAAVMKLQRLVMTVRIAHSALIALQAAMVPGAGWIQIATAGAALGGAAFAASDFMMAMGE